MEENPNYLSIETTVVTEDNYTITHIITTAKKLKEGLKNGELNIVQVGTVEPYLWIVDTTGQRVALLEKDGGWGPSHKVKIRVESLKK